MTELALFLNQSMSQRAEDVCFSALLLTSFEVSNENFCQLDSFFQN